MYMVVKKLGDRQSVVLEYLETRRPELREEIVLTFQRLVESIARKFSYNKSDFDDLYQVGMIGLLKAVDRFDPTMEVAFSTFATPNVIGEIKHYFRDKNRLVKTPRKLQELSSKIKTFLNHASGNGKSPTVAELAAEFEESEERILEALECSVQSSVISLDSPSYQGGGSNDGTSPALIDTIGVDGNEEVLLNKEMLRTVIKRLSERSQEIIYLRYYCGYSQLEIASRVGLSQMHVSRMLTKSVDELRLLLSKD